MSATSHTGQSGCQTCAWRLVLWQTRELTHWAIYRRGQVLSKMWWHLDWIASSAKSLHSGQVVASVSVGTNEVAVVLLPSTRSGWQANISFTRCWAQFPDQRKCWIVSTHCHTEIDRAPSPRNWSNHSEQQLFSVANLDHLFLYLAAFREGIHGQKSIPLFDGASSDQVRFSTFWTQSCQGRSFCSFWMGFNISLFQKQV